MEDLEEFLRHRFSRPEPRRRAIAYIRGLLEVTERRNGWTLARHAGNTRPDGMQRLLRTADWDADGVRDDLRAHAVRRLGTRHAVLLVDEVAFVKKGTHSAGVHRAYCASARRTQNCQIGLLCGYLTPAGIMLVDRELYLPPEWVADRARRRAAGVPPEVGYLSKAGLAARIVERALDGGTQVTGVLAGVDPAQSEELRGCLARRRLPYLLGQFTPGAPPAPRGEQFAAGTMPETHTRLACFAPAMRRCVQSARVHAGLDHYQVRSWLGWYRHLTLAMLAHAHLGTGGDQVPL